MPKTKRLMLKGMGGMEGFRAQINNVNVSKKYTKQVMRMRHTINAYLSS